MWVLALNLTAAIIACVLIIKSNNLSAFLIGAVVLYANILCILNQI